MCAAQPVIRRLILLINFTFSLIYLPNDKTLFLCCRISVTFYTDTPLPFFWSNYVLMIIMIFSYIRLYIHVSYQDDRCP